MTAEEEQRLAVIAGLVASVPKEFLAVMHQRGMVCYADAFQEVRHSPVVLEEQRLNRLRQDRHFRMEWELSEAAKSAGLAWTAKALAENDHTFVYVTAGSVGLTQSYVPHMGAKPQPAKFRDELAQAGRIPRLPLDGEAATLFQPKDFYALVVHTPVGSRFTEDQQKLGSMQICVPSMDSSWALEIGVLELMAHYPVEERRPAARGPVWKVAEKREGDKK